MALYIILIKILPDNGTVPDVSPKLKLKKKKYITIILITMGIKSGQFYIKSRKIIFTDPKFVSNSFD